MYLAARHGWTKILKILHEAGGDINKPCRVRRNEKTLLYPIHAASYFHPNIVEFMQSKLGAKLDVIACDAYYPLHLICWSPRLSEAEVMTAVVVRLPRILHALGQNAKTFIVNHKAKGYTPILAALLMNRPKLVEILLAHGADPNAKADDGHTIFSLASCASKTSLQKPIVVVVAYK